MPNLLALSVLLQMGPPQPTWSDCMTGPGRLAPEACQHLDHDGDSDVDIRDYLRVDTMAMRCDLECDSVVDQIGHPMIACWVGDTLYAPIDWEANWGPVWNDLECGVSSLDLGRRFDVCPCGESGLRDMYRNVCYDWLGWRVREERDWYWAGETPDECWVACQLSPGACPEVWNGD